MKTPEQIVAETAREIAADDARLKQLLQERHRARLAADASRERLRKERPDLFPPALNAEREARELTRRALYRFIAFATAALVALVFVSLCGCSSTRPLDAYTRTNGTRVGVSKNVVFLRGYDANEGLAVAQDNAGITSVDSVTVRRRVRAIGSAYITTVTGK